MASHGHDNQEASPRSKAKKERKGFKFHLLLKSNSSSQLLNTMSPAELALAPATLHNNSSPDLLNTGSLSAYPNQAEACSSPKSIVSESSSVSSSSSKSNSSTSFSTGINSHSPSPQKSASNVPNSFASASASSTNTATHAHSHAQSQANGHSGTDPSKHLAGSDAASVAQSPASSTFSKSAGTMKNKGSSASLSSVASSSVDEEAPAHHDRFSKRDSYLGSSSSIAYDEAGSPSPKSPIGSPRSLPHQIRVGHNVPHRFYRTHAYLSPTVCNVCNKLLWGARLGVQCAYCGFNCHTACSKLAPALCGLPPALHNLGTVLSLLARSDDTFKNHSDPLLASPALPFSGGSGAPSGQINSLRRLQKRLSDTANSTERKESTEAMSAIRSRAPSESLISISRSRSVSDRRRSADADIATDVRGLVSQQRGSNRGSVGLAIAQTNDVAVHRMAVSADVTSPLLDAHSFGFEAFQPMAADSSSSSGVETPTSRGVWGKSASRSSSATRSSPQQRAREATGNVGAAKSFPFGVESEDGNLSPMKPTQLPQVSIRLNHNSSTESVSSDGRGSTKKSDHARGSHAVMVASSGSEPASPSSIVGSHNGMMKSSSSGSIHNSFIHDAGSRGVNISSGAQSPRVAAGSRIAITGSYTGTSPLATVDEHEYPRSLLLSSSSHLFSSSQSSSSASEAETASASTYSSSSHSTQAAAPSHPSPSSSSSSATGSASKNSLFISPFAKNQGLSPYGATAFERVTLLQTSPESLESSERRQQNYRGGAESPLGYRSPERLHEKEQQQRQDRDGESEEQRRDGSSSPIPTITKEFMVIDIDGEILSHQNRMQEIRPMPTQSPAPKSQLQPPSQDSSVSGGYYLHPEVHTNRDYGEKWYLRDSDDNDDSDEGEFDASLRAFQHHNGEYGALSVNPQDQPRVRSVSDAHVFCFVSRKPPSPPPSNAWRDSSSENKTTSASSTVSHLLTPSIFRGRDGAKSGGLAPNLSIVTDQQHLQDPDWGSQQHQQPQQRHYAGGHEAQRGRPAGNGSATRLRASGDVQESPLSVASEPETPRGVRNHHRQSPFSAGEIGTDQDDEIIANDSVRSPTLSSTVDNGKGHVNHLAASSSEDAGPRYRYHDVVNDDTPDTPEKDMKKSMSSSFVSQNRSPLSAGSIGTDSSLEEISEISRVVPRQESSFLQSNMAVSSAEWANSTQSIMNSLAASSGYDDIEIDFDEIVLEDKLGAGSFGEVYKGWWHGPVAVKKLRMSNPTPEQINDWTNEIGIMRKIRHERVLLFMGVCVKPPHLAIVTALCEKGSLYRHLHVLDTSLEVAQVIGLALQIAQGMEYLHARGIIHRDLKSQNILLNENMDVKLADFGLASLKKDNRNDHSKLLGSAHWMSPEIVRNKMENPYTEKADVYAYAMVLYELMTNELPFSGCSTENVIFQIGMGVKPSLELIKGDMPKGLRDVMILSWATGPDLRPPFPVILKSLNNVMLKYQMSLRRSRSIPTRKRSRSTPIIPEMLRVDLAKRQPIIAAMQQAKAQPAPPVTEAAVQSAANADATSIIVGGGNTAFISDALQSTNILAAEKSSLSSSSFSSSSSSSSSSASSSASSSSSSITPDSNNNLDISLTAATTDDSSTLRSGSFMKETDSELCVIPKSSVPIFAYQKVDETRKAPSVVPGSVFRRPVSVESARSIREEQVSRGSRDSRESIAFNESHPASQESRLYFVREPHSAPVRDVPPSLLTPDRTHFSEKYDDEASG